VSSAPPPPQSAVLPNVNACYVARYMPLTDTERCHRRPHSAPESDAVPYDHELVLGNALGECATRRTRARSLSHSKTCLWKAVSLMVNKHRAGNPGYGTSRAISIRLCALRIMPCRVFLHWKRMLRWLKPKSETFPMERKEAGSVEERVL